jgi:hypothetical protein
MAANTVHGKMGNMKKSVEWVIYPESKDGKRTIQSSRRIAQVNLETGKAILSDGKCHPAFLCLNAALGAVEVDCPKEILDKLKETKVESGPIRVV